MANVSLGSEEVPMRTGFHLRELFGRLTSRCRNWPPVQQQTVRVWSSLYLGMAGRALYGRCDLDSPKCRPGDSALIADLECFQMVGAFWRQCSEALKSFGYRITCSVQLPSFRELVIVEDLFAHKFLHFISCNG